MPDNSDTIALPSLHPLLDSVAYKSIPFGSSIASQQSELKNGGCRSSVPAPLAGCGKLSSRPLAHYLHPELSEVMIKVEVGMAHALGPGHLPKRGVRSEFAPPSTEALKQNAEFL